MCAIAAQYLTERYLDGATALLAATTCWHVPIARLKRRCIVAITAPRLRIKQQQVVRTLVCARIAAYADSSYHGILAPPSYVAGARTRSFSFAGASASGVSVALLLAGGIARGVLRHPCRLIDTYGALPLAQRSVHVA